MKVINNNCQIGEQINVQHVEFSSCESAMDVAAKLEKLSENINNAKLKGELDKDSAEEADCVVKIAADQAASTQPDKDKLLRYLETVQPWVSGVGVLASSVKSAITAVGSLF